MTVTTPRKTLAEVIKERHLQLPSTQLQPLEDFQTKALKPFAESLGEVVQAKLADSPNFMNSPLMKFIDALIADLKSRTGMQVSEILHHPDMQELERTHATIEKLLFNPENTRVKYRLLNVTRDDLRNDHAEANGVPEKMQAYRPLCRDEFHRPGGRANTQFHLGGTVGLGDVGLLKTLAMIAKENCAVLQAQLDPALVCPEDPTSEAPPTDFRSLSDDPEQVCTGLTHEENAPLTSWQQTEEATNVVFSTVRVLARPPYDPMGFPAVGAPFFKETIDAHEHYLWMPQTVALGKRLAASFSKFEVSSEIVGIHSGGKESVPQHVIKGEKVQFEKIIDDLLEPVLSRHGTFSFVPWKYKDFAVLFAAQTAFVPTPSGDDQIDAEVALAGRLQYVLLKHQMGHLLKKKLREAIGMKLDEAGVKAFLEAEFLRFVTPDARSVKDAGALARKPFKQVQVAVKQAGPGSYTAKAELVPHIALCSVNVTLKIAAEVSPNKA